MMINPLVKLTTLEGWDKRNPQRKLWMDIIVKNTESHRGDTDEDAEADEDEDNVTRQAINQL